MIGANVQVPLSDRLGPVRQRQLLPAQRRRRRRRLRSRAATTSAWASLWYFGGHAVSHSINGACWLPYMPVANNSTFLVDQIRPLIVPL